MRKSSKMSKQRKRLARKRVESVAHIYEWKGSQRRITNVEKERANQTKQQHRRGQNRLLFS